MKVSSHRFVRIAALSLFSLIAGNGLQSHAQEKDIASAEGAATLQFVDLFDGKTLDGWNVKGGNAKYSVEDGVIVGTSVPNTENTFLCTDKSFKDFVLEYETIVDPRLNSGVMFRALVFDTETMVEVGEGGKPRKIPAGRVHGYQSELDANKLDRSWMGGIYDEARRGWIFPGTIGGDPKAFTAQGQQLYKPEEWNSFRVEAVGDHIRTFMNGELRADFHDDMTAEGFIGLQVHGVGKSEDAFWAKWRNIRIAEME